MKPSAPAQHKKGKWPRTLYDTRLSADAKGCGAVRIYAPYAFRVFTKAAGSWALK